MTKVFSTRWCRGEGSMGLPYKKTTFPTEFCDEYYTMYLYTKNNHIQSKKKKRKEKKRKEKKRKEKKRKKKEKTNKQTFTASKWRPNNPLSFRVVSILATIWKTTFPKGIFNEIWLIIEDHDYINTAEKKKLEIFIPVGF